ncbi:hypothetical protein RND71_020839 [Anisodus tanguticus]|uniref:Uncharacterized protein n=1 Tax=Anisodus tanguticus TaxID=243964 RepID=A0AAE1RUV0_9SOLA|nr:hypothetical protein RND71_020839 [Anisodus tanguticus]
MEQQQQQQQQVVKVKNSGMISYSGSPMIDDRDEEMTRSALSAFRATEEEIERKRKETKRLAEIREGKVPKAKPPTCTRGSLVRWDVN